MPPAASPPTERRIWLLVWAVLALAALAYPLHQLAQTGGYVYYVNGYDEFAYLQADFSHAVQSVIRPGQYGVSLGHAIGLSGGKLNALWDAVSLIAFPGLCWAIFRRLGWTPAQAGASALTMMGLPLFFGAINPLVERLQAWNIASGAIYWLNVPELHTPAILRTPEPQFSLTLLAVGVLLALRLRSYWPIYPILAFMYPFVAIPSAFVLLACHMARHWRPSWPWRHAGPLAIAFVAIATAYALYARFLIDARTQAFLVPTFLPLVSFTGLAALIAFVTLRRWIPARLAFPALAIALAPWAASNQQCLSGYLAQPDNFEQYFGSFAVTLLVVFAVAAHVRYRAWVVALASLLFLRSSYVSFKTNQATNDRLPLTPSLAEALRSDAAHVVVNDLALASVLNMVHPQQPSTALGIERIYGSLADRSIGAYRCLKHQAALEHPGDAGLRRAFQFLDLGYEFGGQNVTIVNIKRKTHFKSLREVSAIACPPRPLRYELLP